MRIIIEWLDKDGNVLIEETPPSPINFGDSVQSPVIPEVKAVIELPGHAVMCSAVMEEAANRYLKEIVTAFRIHILDDPEKKVKWLHTFEFRQDMVAPSNLCECCGKYPHQYTLSDNDYEYKVCANCLPALVNTALSPTQFFNLIRNGHTTKEHLLHGDFYDDETGEALQPR